MSWSVVICDWRNVSGDMSWKPVGMVPTPTRVVLFKDRTEAQTWANRNTNNATTCVVVAVEQ